MFCFGVLCGGILWCGCCLKLFLVLLWCGLCLKCGFCLLWLKCLCGVCFLCGVCIGGCSRNGVLFCSILVSVVVILMVGMFCLFLKCFSSWW